MIGEEEGNGRAKKGLVVSVIIVVLLIVSVYFLYIRVQDLQAQIDVLKVDKYNLQDEVDSLTTQVDDLQSQIDSLTAYDLRALEGSWTDYHPSNSSPYVNYRAIIFNAGMEEAPSVHVMVRILDHQYTIRSAIFDLGDIGGRSYRTLDVNVTYSGEATFAYLPSIYSLHY